MTGTFTRWSRQTADRCCHPDKPHDSHSDSLKLSQSLNSITSEGCRGANLFQSLLGETGRSNSSEVSGAEVLHFECTSQHASAQRAVSQDGYAQLPACWHQVFLQKQTVSMLKLGSCLSYRTWAWPVQFASTMITRCSISSFMCCCMLPCDGNAEEST